MLRSKPWALLATLLLVFSVARQASAQDGDGESSDSPSTLPLDQLQLPPDFHAKLLTNDTVRNARMMALGQAENSSYYVVYVSSTSAGVVTAVVKQGYNATACQLLKGQQTPNGIAYRNGSLYVATVTAITRFDNVDAATLAGCNSSLLSSEHIASLPDYSGHTSRALAIGPDDKLYVGLGSVDNAGVCKPPTCSIQRLNLDGSGQETFSSNIRNPAGLAFSPSGQLWFTDMGRDNMGDNQPDDTLFSMQLNQTGSNLQFPYCHWVGTGDPLQRDPGPGYPLADDATSPPGQSLADGQSRNESFGGWCAREATAPVQSLGPHVAPVGLVFYEAPPTAAAATDSGSSAFPQQYTGALFIAEHGSWNRGQKIGYRVAQLTLTPEGKPANYTIFASGWLRDDGSVWGRPVGVLVAPDGSLLVSDDTADTVYQIYYSPSS